MEFGVCSLQFAVRSLEFFQSEDKKTKNAVFIFIFHFSFIVPLIFCTVSSYNAVKNTQICFMRGDVVHAQDIRPGGNGRQIRGNGGVQHCLIGLFRCHRAYKTLA